MLNIPESLDEAKGANKEQNDPERDNSDFQRKPCCENLKQFFKKRDIEDSKKNNKTERITYCEKLKLFFTMPFTVYVYDHVLFIYIIYLILIY